MKKLVLTASISLLCTAALPGGFATFGNNFGPSAGRFPIYGLDTLDPTLSLVGQSSLGVPAGTTPYTGPLLQGSGYTLALFAGPSSVTDADLLSFVTSAPFRTATANVLPAGLVTVATITIDGVLAGSQARFEYRAWDNQGGTITTWDDAVTSGTAIGRSGLFLSAPLGGTTPDDQVLLPPMLIATSFNIHLVPEPSTTALFALASLLLLRPRGRKSV